MGYIERFSTFKRFKLAKIETELLLDQIINRTNTSDKPLALDRRILQSQYAIVT